MTFDINEIGDDVPVNEENEEDEDDDDDEVSIKNILSFNELVSHCECDQLFQIMYNLSVDLNKESEINPFTLIEENKTMEMEEWLKCFEKEIIN